jgi:hypothetical protein
VRIDKRHKTFRKGLVICNSGRQNLLVLKGVVEFVQILRNDRAQGTTTRPVAMTTMTDHLELNV